MYKIRIITLLAPSLCLMEILERGVANCSEATFYTFLVISLE